MAKIEDSISENDVLGHFFAQFSQLLASNVTLHFGGQVEPPLEQYLLGVALLSSSCFEKRLVLLESHKAKACWIVDGCVDPQIFSRKSDTLASLKEESWEVLQKVSMSS